MKNEHLEILVNKYIDNELSNSEKAELEALLTEQANKEYFESMTGLFEKIDSLEHTEKEISIADTVTRQIRNSESYSFMKIITIWFSEIFNGQKIGYGISFAVGVVLVGIITLFQTPQNNFDNDMFSGTMSDRNFDETFFIDRHPINGAVKIQYSEGVVVLDVSLKSEKLINCELKFDKTALAFYGVKNLSPGKASKFSSNNNGIYLSEIESDHYLVFLRILKKTSSDITAKFYDGITVIENIKMKVNN